MAKLQTVEFDSGKMAAQASILVKMDRFIEKMDRLTNDLEDTKAMGKQLNGLGLDESRQSMQGELQGLTAKCKELMSVVNQV